MGSAPRVILFDLGDTLLRDTRVDIDSAIQWLLEPSDPSSLDEIKGFLGEHYRTIRRTLRTGLVEYPIRNFLRLAQDLARAPRKEPIEAIELEFWQRLASMEPLPGLGEVLNELAKRDIRLGVVSNSMFSGEVLRHLLREHRLLDFFEIVVSSADYGVQKPHPLVFQAALSQMDARPGEGWFVGDNFQKDIEGATAVGMTAVWLSKKQGSTELPSNCIRIESWGEFVPLLDNL